MQKPTGAVTDNVSMASIGDENGSIDNEDVKLSDIELETASNDDSNNSAINQLQESNFREEEWQN
jgi:hypothetical protein